MDKHDPLDATTMKRPTQPLKPSKLSKPKPSTKCKLTLPHLIFCVATSTLLVRILISYLLYPNCNRWGLIIDAGSSGSRIHIFTWKEYKSDLLLSLKEVSNFKISPGISSFTPTEASQSLEPLLQHAKATVPQHCWAHTNLQLLATAGMRLVHQVNPARSTAIFDSLRNYLKTAPFLFDPPNARIVPGDEEAEFDWLSVNFATDGFVTKQKLVGAIDLGGASTQISFQVHPSEQGSSVVDVAQLPGVRTLQVGAHAHSIYAVSRLHMGLYEAYTNTQQMYAQQEQDAFPCEIPGDYDKCQTVVQHFLTQHAEQDMSQLGLTAMAPPIQTGSTFYGLDNFAKLASIHFIFQRNPMSRQLPPQLFRSPNMKSYQNVAKQLCKMSWYELRSRIPIKVGKDKLLQHSCFGLIYVQLLLERVYRLKGGEVQLIFAHTIGQVDGSWATGAAISLFHKDGSGRNTLKK